MRADTQGALLQLSFFKNIQNRKTSSAGDWIAAKGAEKFHPVVKGIGDLRRGPPPRAETHCRWVCRERRYPEPRFAFRIPRNAFPDVRTRPALRRQRTRRLHGARDD